MYGRFFGLLAFRNTINNGGQARADDKGPPLQDDDLEFGSMSFGVRSAHEEHLINLTETTEALYSR